MVPDLDDLSITNAEHVDDRDVFTPAEDLHPPDVRLEVPLPTRRDEIAFRYLVIDRPCHRPAVPEELSDLFLFARRLHRILSIADVVCDVCRCDQLIYRCRIILKPDLFIESTREGLVLFLDLTAKCKSWNQEQRDG